MLSTETTDGGESTERDLRISGLGVSPGVAVGRVLRLDDRDAGLGMPTEFEAEDVEAEVARVHGAVEAARQQILDIKGRITGELGRGHAYFFEPHLLMLEDHEMLRDIERIIRAKALKAEWAVRVVTDRIVSVYAAVKDDYLRERASDVEDVGNRVIRALTGGRTAGTSPLQKDVVIVGRSITPSAIVELDLSRVLGFAAEAGGFASHSAIIARSLGLPAVVGLSGLAARVDSGDPIVVDGSDGCVILSPTKSVLRRYLEQRDEQRRIDLSEDAPAEAVTLDGHKCTVRANVELLSELDSVARYGAAGIGLYRSEFLLLGMLPDLPSEDEQAEVFERVVVAAGEHGATIRVFDLGGDKIGADGFDADRNPALGLRGIRLALGMPEFFRSHLRAVLRASARGRVRIVLPMIARLSELRAARQLIEECKEELRSEGRPFDPTVPLGVMIEVPSAVVIADHLAAECDFFSVGTNDLTQHLLAVDRTNQRVAHLYEPMHPSVLRSLERIRQVAREAGIPALICGEMASNPVHVAALLGLGFDKFSIAPALVPLIKRVICSVHMSEARELAMELLTMRSAPEISEHLASELPRRFPSFFGT